MSNPSDKYDAMRRALRLTDTAATGWRERALDAEARVEELEEAERKALNLAGLRLTSITHLNARMANLASENARMQKRIGELEEIIRGMRVAYRDA